MTKYAVCASILMLLSSTLTASAEHDDPAWIVHREYPGPFHLGDENIGSWASLVGSCMDVTFPAVESGGKVQLLYEPYGVENAYLELDDGRRFSLAPQVVQSGTRPNYWGTREYIIIDVLQSSGSMSGRVCSDFLDPTDLDDLMLQNLATLGLPPATQVPNSDSDISLNNNGISMLDSLNISTIPDLINFLSSDSWTKEPHCDVMQVGLLISRVFGPEGSTVSLFPGPENGCRSILAQNPNACTLPVAIIPQTYDIISESSFQTTTLPSTDSCKIYTRYEIKEFSKMTYESSTNGLCPPAVERGNSFGTFYRCSENMSRSNENFDVRDLAPDRQIASQRTSLYQCGENVDCNDRQQILSALARAYETMRNSSDLTVGIYREMCFDSFSLIDSLHSAIDVDAGIAQGQLDVCNMGLRELNK